MDALSYGKSKVYCIKKLKLLTSKIKSIIAITNITKRMEQRAQLTQNEVQWYKYLNYTARAYLHGWQAVTFPVEAEAIYLKTRRYILVVRFSF